MPEEDSFGVCYRIYKLRKSCCINDEIDHICSSFPVPYLEKLKYVLRRIRMGMREFYAGKSSVMNCFSTGDACDRIEK